MTMAPPTTSSRRDPAYARALDFERAMRIASGLAWPIPRGLLIADPAHPLVWDVNTLWLDDVGDATADELVAEAGRLQAPAGLAHRSVLVVDEHDWTRLSPGFSAAGYMVQVNAVMAHRGAAPAAPAEAVETDADPALVKPAATAYIAAEPFGADADAAAQVLSHVLRRPGGADERWCTISRDGAVVAYARLWQAGDVAQVEDVVVLEPWRRQGLGRAVVAAATRVALTASPELLFIVADDDDWPKDLYASLGYETVGRLAIFRQVPAAV